MIGYEEALSALHKLEAQRDYGRLHEPGRIEVLCEALAECAGTVDHAKRILDRWIERSDDLPTPRELRQVADEVPAVTSAAPVRCGKCTEGWLRVYWWQRSASERGVNFTDRQPMTEEEYCGSTERESCRARDGWVPYSGCRPCPTCRPEVSQ